jgi:hypothetical protein
MKKAMPAVPETDLERMGKALMNLFLVGEKAIQP